MENLENNVKQSIEKIDEYNNTHKFKDTWESLYQYNVPEWFKDAKLGIFFHWGVYTVPQMGSEWYSRNMYQQNSTTYEYHIKNYGKHSDFGYKELIPKFTGEKFNAQSWLSLAENLNAKYFIPVAEHHDGFQMYKSQFSKFNAKEMGPKQDIIKELSNEVEETNINFGVSSHRAEHYWFMDGGLEFDSGIDNPKYGDLYWPALREEDLKNDTYTNQLFLEDWLVRTCELVDLFNPRILYFDWWIEMPQFKPYMRKFLAYFYNKNIENYGDPGVVNYKHDGVPYMVAVRDMERGHFANIQPDYWQCCTSAANNSWSYTKNNTYKSSIEIIQTLIDVISKNGNLLLNAGPHTNGSIVKEEIELFSEVGNWVKEHEQAIFKTRPWKVFGEGDNNTSGGNFSENQVIKYKKYDIRFTMNKNKIYVFIMNPQNEQRFEIRSMAISKGVLTHHAVIKNVKAISKGIEISDYMRTANCLEINVDIHNQDKPIVFEVEIE